MTEVSRTFTCFGGATTVAVEGTGPEGGAEQAVQMAIDLLLDLHATFTRFKPESELSALNRDPAEQVAVSPVMARFVQAAVDAARRTGGLVDCTLLEVIEEAGYKQDRFKGTLALPLALALAPPRKPAAGSRSRWWEQVAVEHETCVVVRPPGLRFDGGGMVKGLAADIVAGRLADYDGFAVDCEGDIRVGGTQGEVRMLEVPNPFSGPVLHEFEVADGALATSSIVKRSWLQMMRPTHHLMDPSSRAPAFTGVVQVSALAPTAVEGEVLAKAALLSGPEGVERWLPHGGVAVYDDGSRKTVQASSGDG
ncbi:MAG TPA: FAD:protein FMN transferase [Actinomycetota bacterium]|nr:FAD:protein FMN transferase [Actinomycetota bacterium]